jgi:hypothetical protein
MIDLNEITYNANTPDEDFGYVPGGTSSGRKFKLGDAEHVKLAVPTFVNWSFRGNAPDIPTSAKPGLKRKIAAAIHKYLSGDEAKYYAQWLSSGKQPDKKTGEARRVREMYIAAPSYRVEDEPNFPDVPLTVSLDLIKARDPDPVLVTRPLAILGEVSENGLVYNEAICEAILAQVNAKKPAARRGHVAETNRSSAFPPDAGYWVGAMEDTAFYGKKAIFGKCWVVPGTPMREMALNRQVTGTPLSNSIWGSVAEREDEQGNTVPVGLTLETIDFVPAERAALQALGGQFTITSETIQEETTMDGDESLTDLLKGKAPGELYAHLSEAGHGHKLAEMHLKEGKCAECTGSALHEMLGGHSGAVCETHLRESATPEETYAMLPEGHRKHVAEAYAREMGLGMAPLGETNKQASEMVSVQRQLAEMQNVIKSYQRQDYERGLQDTVDGFYTDWNVVTPDGRGKLDSLKRQHRLLTVAEMAGSAKLEDIAPAAAKAWDELKPVAETMKVALAGPNAFVSYGTPSNNNPYGYDRATGRYSDEAVDKARRGVGLPDVRSKGGN